MDVKSWVERFMKEGLWLEGEASGAVDYITSDSRELQRDSRRAVFFARKGATTDGHDYLKSLEGLTNVATFVVQKKPEGFRPKAPVIVVRDSTAAMALAAKNFYGDPTSSSFCVGVTGTNGKTTTTFLVQALLEEAGYRTARNGTIELQFEDVKIPSSLTTPDFSQLQKMFSEVKAKGANAFVFEASSHAIEQRRLLGLELDACLFTNLSPEHLDYHQTMENYFQAKRKLFFDLLPKSEKKKKVAILPDDGSYGSRIIRDLEFIKDVEVISWGFQKRNSDKHLYIESWSTNLEGLKFKVSGVGLKSTEFRSKLIGKYNVENVVGMIALGLGMGLPAAKIQAALDKMPPVAGRLEKVKVPAVGAIFVDYAHTPDALENVLMTLRPLTEGKLRVVFGCGGDRDRTKRPKMAAIAELYADEIFVTSDNPRTEDPEAIIHEILQGLQRLKPVHIEVDRRKSILKSVQSLGPKDVVLIAGKGHEDYQILGTEKIHFDDREVVQSGFAS